MKQIMVIQDDEYKAFFNTEAICMFRLKLPESGEAIKADEVEITFVGGGKTKLHGQSAKHFIEGAIRMMGGI